MSESSEFGALAPSPTGEDERCVSDECACVPSISGAIGDEDHATTDIVEHVTLGSDDDPCATALFRTSLASIIDCSVCNHESAIKYNSKHCCHHY